MLFSHPSPPFQNCGFRPLNFLDLPLNIATPGFTLFFISVSVFFFTFFGVRDFRLGFVPSVEVWLLLIESTKSWLTEVPCRWTKRIQLSRNSEHSNFSNIVKIRLKWHYVSLHLCYNLVRKNFSLSHFGVNYKSCGTELYWWKQYSVNCKYQLKYTGSFHTTV